MRVVYAREAMPTVGTASIFLAGPSPRGTGVPSWRPEALAILETLGFDGHVYVPEPRSGVWDKIDPAGKTEQIIWEDTALERSDVVVFWIPRDLENLPGLTTNDEWGRWKESGKVVLGTPPGAPHTNYQRHYAKTLSIPMFDTLADTLAGAVKKVEDLGPMLRTGGELTVPLHIWNTPNFQSWIRFQKDNGNRLEDSRVKFALWAGGSLFFWCLSVNVWIGAEKRNKTNEVLFSRPNISTVVLHGPVYVGALGATEIVLVKEFRSPVNNPIALVLEAPSGSSHNPQDTPLDIAVSEVKEETGREISPARFVPHGARQVAATMSIHQSNLFSIELSQAEVEWFKQRSGVARGVESDSERTYVTVETLAEIMASKTVDWSMMGMVLTSVLASGDMLG